MRFRLISNQIRFGFTWLFFAVLAAGAGSVGPSSAEQKQHTGVRVDGFAISVTPGAMTVFDKKRSEEIEMATAKDYTSLIGIASPVTVWYTTKDGVNHLEDIVYGSAAAAFVPSDEIGEGIKRIIVLAQPEDVEDTQGLVSAITGYIADNTGWFVAPSELAQEIATRNDAFTSPEDAIDPATGEFDKQRYLQIQGSLMRIIAKGSHTDAVLQIKILKVKASVHGAVASWDGMTEAVGSRSTRALTPWEGLGGKGWVYAATADMYFWSNAGKLLWKNRRGFAALAVQSGFGGKYRQRPLTDVYTRQDVMQRWLASALGQLAPSEKGTETATPSPVPPEIQQQLDNARH